MNIRKYLEGKDLRSIASVSELVDKIKTQSEFDELFGFVFMENRLLVMRASDAIEKVSLKNPHFLRKYSKEVIDLLKRAKNKELKWHLALISSRLEFDKNEYIEVWKQLKSWLLNKAESKIVRVNSLQALYEISVKNLQFKEELKEVIKIILEENIPSLCARIKKLQEKK
jgi:hypothetical protein